MTSDPGRASRGFFEELVRRIPGFRGYFAANERQQSDRQEREYLVQRLQEAKRGLTAAASRLVDQGKLDLLPRIERVGNALDRIIGRIRGSVQRHGWFASDEAAADRLDALYDHDLALSQLVEQFEAAVGQLPDDAQKLSTALADLEEKLQAIDARWTAREEHLSDRSAR